jgi:hypothetical protein
MFTDALAQEGHERHDSSSTDFQLAVKTMTRRAHRPMADRLARRESLEEEARCYGFRWNPSTDAIEIEAIRSDPSDFEDKR